jgi:hypothetical protein
VKFHERSALAVAALLLAGCDGGSGPADPTPSQAAISVTISTTGRPLDRDGYTVRVTGDSVGHVGVDDGVTIHGVPLGRHAVSLDGLRHNCTVDGGESRTVELRAGATVSVSFAVTCAPTDIAFVARAYGDGPWGLYVQRGSGAPELLVPRVDISRVTWSPDGHKIAYTVPFGFIGGTDLWYFDVDSMKGMRVDVPGAARHPNWSPDGQRLVFVMARQGTYPEIWTSRLDGRGAVNLTFEAGVSRSLPAWSPDGSRIAYVRWRDGDSMDREIWTMNADGSDARFVTKICCGGENSSFTWSRDGARIIFSAAQREDAWGPAAYQIYSVNRDGSNRVKLTSDSLSRWTPAELSDGRIGFNRYGETWTMNADGSDARSVDTVPWIEKISLTWQ